VLLDVLTTSKSLSGIPTGLWRIISNLTQELISIALEENSLEAKNFWYYFVLV
jgi:hypothetical protein